MNYLFNCQLRPEPPFLLFLATIRTLLAWMNQASVTSVAPKLAPSVL
ncbi:hypothetical protein LCGC14_2139700 [marine sediment metagenome]|uniref:Uncharacterized protein n=1 Tax=marine sediment metagenome TaxID=412755 RepID=A0A0F9EL12_9ZZZZ